MSKLGKILLIIGAVLVAIGIALFCIVMTACHWDFRKLSTIGFETRTHTITDQFQNISISTDTTDILFVPTDANETKIVCYEEENSPHTVSVNEGTLSIALKDAREWYNKIGIGFGTPKITIYLPVDSYVSLTIKNSTGDTNIPGNFTFQSVVINASTGDAQCAANVTDALNIHLSTGDIEVNNTEVGAMDLKVTTGEISIESVDCRGDIGITVSTGESELSNVTCTKVHTVGNTGEIELANVIAKEEISIERTTGDVDFDRCDALSLSVNTDTGSVKGTLLSDKIFVVQTSTGRIDVPETVNGGKCRVTTDTGDIIIRIVN